MSWASLIIVMDSVSLACSLVASWAAQPLITTGPLLSLSPDRTARRLLAVAREVTAQLWTSVRSGDSPLEIGRNPREQRSSDICWASYWLTLQPMTFTWYVFKVITNRQCRLELNSRQSVSGRRLAFFV
jgi:hypothetical protein